MQEGPGCLVTRSPVIASRTKFVTVRKFLEARVRIVRRRFEGVRRAVESRLLDFKRKFASAASPVRVSSVPAQGSWSRKLTRDHSIHRRRL